MKIDYTKIDNIEIDGIDHRDAPDYCDAFISSCDIDGREATDEELDEINQDSDFVHQKVYEKLY